MVEAERIDFLADASFRLMPISMHGVPQNTGRFWYQRRCYSYWLSISSGMAIAGATDPEVWLP